MNNKVYGSPPGYNLPTSQPMTRPYVATDIVTTFAMASVAAYTMAAVAATGLGGVEWHD